MVPCVIMRAELWPVIAGIGEGNYYPPLVCYGERAFETESFRPCDEAHAAAAPCGREGNHRTRPLAFALLQSTEPGGYVPGRVPEAVRPSLARPSIGACRAESGTNGY
jgi:hypothetical protein